MPKPKPSEPAPFSRREWLIVVLLLLASLVAAHYSMIFSGFVFTQGSGDSVLANYRMEHNWRWVLQQAPHTSLFSPPMFYPEPHMAAISDLFLGALPFYAPWRAAGAPPQAAYQIFVFAISALNFLSMYWVLRAAARTGPLASFAGAFLFAFGSPRMMKLGHVQMVIAFYTVWAMAGVWMIFRNRPRIWTGALLLAVSFALQLYTAFYYAWFMVFSAVVALVYVLLKRELRSSLAGVLRESWLPLLVSGALGAALVAPAAIEYSRVLNQVGGKSFAEVTHFLPGIRAWIAQGPAHAFYGRMDRTLGIDQNFGFGEMLNGVGLVTTILMVCSFVKLRSRPMVAIWGVVSLVAIIATLSWHGVTLWRFVYLFFPGAQAVRVVSRFGLFLLLPAAIGVALAIEWLAGRYSRSVAMLCTAIVIAEQAGAFPAIGTFNKDQFEGSAVNVTRALRPECKALLFSSRRGGTTRSWMHLIGMWAELISRVPSLNGYQWPPGSPIDDVEIGNRFDRVRLYEGLRTWMLRYPSLDNVCWVSPGEPSADVIRQADLDGQPYELRKTYLAMQGRLPSQEELASLPSDPAAFAAAVEALPGFQSRELFAFAAYRRLLRRDPGLADWVKAVDDLHAKRKTDSEVIEDWQKTEECRGAPGCAGTPPDAVLHDTTAALPAGEREHDLAVLLFYCLLQRAPSAGETRPTAIREAFGNSPR